jgi:peptidoglycan/LPS O-acetylase OafA/YrhL
MVGGAAHRIGYLDGWRGLAIIAVLIGHFGKVEPELGSYGVELFFVLSGRLMSQILFEKRLPLPTFFRRRFSRIYPALLVLVIGLSLLSVVAGLLGSDRSIDPLSAVAALTFTSNYMPLLGHPVAGTLDHTWSLAVEEHCYALLAIIAVLAARRTKWVVHICFALAIMAMLNGLRLNYAGAGKIHEVYWRTDVRLAPVFLSAAIYLCKPKRGSLVALALSLPLFLILPTPLKFIVSTALLAYAVNAIDHADERAIQLLSNRVLVQVGLISYSLYLWQQLMYKMTDGSVIGIPPALMIAWLSYRYVEGPSRKAINAFRMPALRYS